MPQWLLKQRPCKAASGKCTTCYFGNRMFGAALPTRQCCLILTRKLFDLTCISLEMTSTATKFGSASSPTKRVPGRWGSKSLRRFLSINIKWERTRPTLRECEASSMRQKKQKLQDRTRDDQVALSRPCLSAFAQLSHCE